MSFTSGSSEEVGTQASQPGPDRPPEGGTTASQAHEGYALAEPEPLPPPLSTEASDAATFRPAASDDHEAAAEPVFPDELPEVGEVWNRWAEWKLPLIWSVGGMTLAIAIVLGGQFVPFLIFSSALAYGAYQIVISLEVPVRVTPEQAVREFYLAASHRLPNFRRMYALLTTRAKRSPEFSDYASFRTHWMSQISRIGSHPTWFVPLEFRVERFRCRYNGEKNMAHVKYYVAGTPRGRSHSKSDEAFEACHLAVKGPDGQWYLDGGVGPF